MAGLFLGSGVQGALSPHLGVQLVLGVFSPESHGEDLGSIQPRTRESNSGGTTIPAARGQNALAVNPPML
jgi:hypothetical protein